MTHRAYLADWPQNVGYNHDYLRANQRVAGYHRVEQQLRGHQEVNVKQEASQTDSSYMVYPIQPNEHPINLI